jgi:hypothetical protein
MKRTWPGLTRLGVGVSRSLGEAQALIPGFKKALVGVEAFLAHPVTVLDGTLVLYLPPDGFGVLFRAELSCPRPNNRSQAGCH